MGDKTKISWCDHTFNPWIGCTKVGPGCDHCYAERLAKAYGRAKWGNHPRERTTAANWKKPLKWQRDAAAAGKRPFVFCASMADVFDNQVDPQWRADLARLIQDTPNLVWLLLTKRPQNIMRMMPMVPPNVLLGCTVVNQEEANRDVRIITRTANAVGALGAFLSCEPLLGPIEFERPWLEDLVWIITGLESGHGARIPDPPLARRWVREIRDQALGADVAFHHKQWGAMEEGNTLDGNVYEERPLIGAVHV